MYRLPYLLLSAVVFSSSLGAQTRGDTPSDAAVYAVSYVEVMPSSRAGAIVALKAYRDASRNDDGYVRLELLEQLGRPGHFVILETWREQRAFDTHGMAGHTRQFLNTLKPIRVSDYDQRPYKAITVASARSAANGQIVHIVTHVDTLPAPQSDAPELLRRLAEASRKDEGNLRFDVLQHATRGNHFTVVETWQTQKALDAHLAAAHTTEYREMLHSMLGSPLDERLCRAIQ
jgi:quinol monooxygenase YgiN